MRQLCPIGSVLALQNGDAIIGRRELNSNATLSGAAYVVRNDASTPADDACSCRVTPEPACSDPTPLTSPKNGSCPIGYWLFRDSICGIGGVDCNDVGDGMCHVTCTSNRDCADPCRPHCASQILWNNVDSCGSLGPLICSPKAETDCPM